MLPVHPVLSFTTASLNEGSLAFARSLTLINSNRSSLLTIDGVRLGSSHMPSSAKAVGVSAADRKQMSRAVHLFMVEGVKCFFA